MNKLNLYKENIIKFMENNNLKINNIEEIDYIIGILFLTEMNRYCKINKINIHGYYVTYGFTNLFIKVKNKLLSKNRIDIVDINNILLYISYNIDYLNSRVDISNPIRQKINNNFSKFIIEINSILINLANYYKDHTNSSEELNSENKDLCVTNNIYCNNKCYICWVDNILSKFFYLLLITAKFMGSGEVKNDPNLFKIAEYFSNIIYTYIKIKNNNLSQIIYSNLFNNYIDNKNKLYYSMFEMNITSKTFDEIIIYLDKIIMETSF
jgi:hypothetical protein